MKIANIITAAAAAIAILVSASGVSAQNPMTPYSRYGYGILRDNATSAQRAMGGVGYAMRSGRQINVMNPASYAAIDSLTFLFDMGISGTKLWSSEVGSDNVRRNGSETGGGLDYLTMQFPLGRYMGASIGLLPYSSTGYTFGSKIDNGSTTRTGTGGINQLYVGVSGRVFKGFTVGANIGYLFGNTTNDTYAYTNGGATSVFETVMKVRDYHLQFGIQYGLPIGRDHTLTFGATYSPGKSLHGNAWGVNYDLDSDTEPDTVAYTSLNRHYSLPDTWGLGVNYQWRQNVMVEADFTYQPWSKAKYSIIDDLDRRQRFNDRYKTAVGIQWVPKPRGNYVQRISYRAGGFCERSYLDVLGNDVREYGASMGFGFPAPGAKTVINLGVEWRRREASPKSLIKEDYFTITLGINFNERWFYQSKIY